MAKYIFKRILAAIPVLFVVSVVVFMIIHLTPGDPARVMLGDQALEEDVEALRESLGLNEPLVVQYINWILGVFRGDLGNSLFMEGTMGSIILEHLYPTIALSLMALIIAILIAIPCGILAAKKKGKITDTVVMSGAMVGISVPNFLLGLLLIIIFAVNLQIFPASGYIPISEDVGQFFYFIILPAFALGLMHAALITRMTRSSMLEVLNSDYIKMAKAKGVGNTKILYVHALKNAALPILTIVGQSMMSLLAGALVTERVFNIPGIGQLVINSINRRDYEVVQAVVLVIALINVIIMLLIDLLYGCIDSRVKANK